VFTSTGTGGGQEMTITSTWTTLAHHGMIIVPIGYTLPALSDISQVRGGTPYGASTIAGGDGSRQPSAAEPDIARHQGETVARLAARLKDWGEAAGVRRRTGVRLEALRGGSGSQGAARFGSGRARGVCRGPAAAPLVVCRWG